MKKLSLILLIGLSFVLSGCSASPSKRPIAHQNQVYQSAPHNTVRPAHGDRNQSQRLRNENYRLRKQLKRQRHTRKEFWPNGAVSKSQHYGQPAKFYRKNGRECDRIAVDHRLNGYQQSTIGYRCHSVWDDGDAWVTR